MMSQKPKDDEDDAQLLRLWQAGDRAAAESLIRRHGPALARFFRNKVFNDGEDLVQETLYRLLDRAKAFSATASVRTYLFSIAHNIFIDHLRRRSRRLQVDFDFDSVIDLGASPSSVVSRSRECMLLAQSLRKLPVNEQVVVELAYWESCTMDDVAAILDIPPGTARSRARQARERLKKLMHANTTVTDDASLDSWLRELRDLLTE
jgi:RNA polymerase sigma-70 factor (ECF subfamily)